MSRGAQAAIPWNVPVRLIPFQFSSDAGEWSTVRVDPGFFLPGIAAIDATVLTADGMALLARLDPIKTGAAGSEGAATRTLTDLLGTLHQDEPGIGALTQDGSVPVAVDGTPFTLAVLTALVRVPAGERVTYTELALAAGRPRAVRAAASVMARNRVPLVLPCHRVVPSSGGTGRFGWGEDVKVALLAAESRLR